MKRISGLFERIISIDNLRLADQKARQGKAHTYGVQLHDRNREANIAALHDKLEAGTFKTSEYNTFLIHEPKERVIYRLPYYPDRIVHHAIMNVMEPIWVGIFTANTYSCIKGRGIQAAADKVKQAIKSDPDGCAYCLKIDIRKFYPSVDHEILKVIVRRKIKDTRLLALLDGIIDSTDGLPIGNYLSQYLANLILAYFDHWLKEGKRVKHYFRYADDIVIFHSDKAFLRTLLADIEAYISHRLKLQVKDNKQIFPVATSHRDKAGRGVDFLGYVFFLRETRLRKSIKQNLARRIANIRHRKHQPTEKAFLQEIASWWGWCKHSDSRKLIISLNKVSPYEIQFRRKTRRNSCVG